MLLLVDGVSGVTVSDAVGGTNILRGHRGPSPELSLENWGPKREASKD